MYHKSSNFKSSIKVLLFLEYLLIKVLTQLWESNSGKVIQLNDHFKDISFNDHKMPISVLY